MTPRRSTWIRDVLLVVAGAAAGAVAGAVASAPAPSATGDAALDRRIADIERRVERAAIETPRRRRHAGQAGQAGQAADAAADDDLARRAAAGLQAAAATTSADDGLGGGGDRSPGGREADDGIVAVSPEFVASVRAAIDTIRREDESAARIQKLRDARAKYVRNLDRRLTDYQEVLRLDDQQLEALRTTALAGMDERLRAQAGGAAAEELASMERERQRSIRDVLGGATYREMRKLELDEMARPTVVSVAGKAGVNSEQRTRIERLLDQHIESIVDLDVRARTEDLSAEERQAIEDRMDAANRAAWDRLRGEILDAEQRERVPKRLR